MTTSNNNLNVNKTMETKTANTDKTYEVGKSVIAAMAAEYKLRTRRFDLSAGFTGSWKVVKIREFISYANRSKKGAKPDTFGVIIENERTKVRVQLPAGAFLNALAITEGAAESLEVASKAFDARFRNSMKESYKDDKFFFKTVDEAWDKSMPFVHEKLGYEVGSKKGLTIPGTFKIVGAMVVEENYFPTDISSLSKAKKEKLDHPFISKYHYKLYSDLEAAMGVENPTKQEVHDAIATAPTNSAIKKLLADPKSFDVPEHMYHNPRYWFNTLIISI